MNQRYVIISPVRNEALHLERTIASVAGQAVIPSEWVIVDDGSTDETATIAKHAAAKHEWIKVVQRTDRGFRKAGGGVVDAFYAGFEKLATRKWDFLVKLDGDVSFEQDYFQNCFLEFGRNTKLGIAGGTVYVEGDNGKLRVESTVDPRFHVRGATKIYRRQCWDQIGGLLRAPGWDTMDEVKANMLGWETYTIPNISILHHRPTGAAYGAWKDRVKNGLGCYIVGYHPLFMFLKSVSRFAKKPYFVGGLGLWFGFLKGYFTREPQIEDRELIKYFRQQQLNRILQRKSLWD